LIANNGELVLENANTSSGVINIGSNVTISTLATGGPVAITIGDAPANPIVGSKPANVIIGKNTGGQAYYGTNSISVPTGPVTINLQGDDVIFNTGTRPASAITIGANTVITADPINFVGVPFQTAADNHIVQPFLNTASAGLSTNPGFNVVERSSLVPAFVTNSGGNVA